MEVILPGLRCNSCDRSRGSVLLAALLITLLATTLVLTATHNSGTRMESSHLIADSKQALVYGRMGLEYGASYISNHSNWRVSSISQTVCSNYKFDEGLFTVTVVDPIDGKTEVDAQGSATCDPVDVTSSVTVGHVTRVLKARYLPVPHLALKYTLFSYGELKLENINIFGRIRSADNKISGGKNCLLQGNMTVPSDKDYPEDLIDADTAVFFAQDAAAIPVVDFSWYRNNGTQLNYAKYLGDIKVTKTVAPGSAGAPNGIYYIDCRGQDIHVGDAYIEACLVFIDVNRVRIGYHDHDCAYYHVSPDQNSLPALLADGDLRMFINGENVPGSVTGIGDIPSYMEGLFYATGKYRGPQRDGGDPFEIRGSIIAGEIEIECDDDTVITHSVGLNNALMPEFTYSTLSPASSSVEEL